MCHFKFSAKSLEINFSCLLLTEGFHDVPTSEKIFPPWMFFFFCKTLLYFVLFIFACSSYTLPSGLQQTVTLDLE